MLKSWYSVLGFGFLPFTSSDIQYPWSKLSSRRLILYLCGQLKIVVELEGVDFERRDFFLVPQGLSVHDDTNLT